MVQRLSGSGVDLAKSRMADALERLVSLRRSRQRQRQPMGLFDRRVDPLWIRRFVLREKNVMPDARKMSQRGSGMFPSRTRKPRWVRRLMYQLSIPPK